MTTKQSILEVKVDPSGAEKGTKRARDAYGRFTKAVKKDNKSITESFKRFVVATSNANTKLVEKMTKQWGRFASFMKDKVANAMKSGIGKAFSALTAGAGKLVGILGPAGVVGGINAVVAAGLQLQKFAITFSVISGNMKEARIEIQNLVELTRKLGSSFEGAAGPAAKFFAASKDSLVSSDIRNIFEAFSEVSVALQLNKQEVTGVFLALQQIASKGRVSMEELRLQLAERVPGAMQLAAKSMGVSMKEFEDSVRKGTINSSEFLINFGKVLHEEFGPAAQLASKLGQSAINRFDLALTLFLNRISETGVLSAFQDFLDTIRKKFLENGVVAEALGKAVTDVVSRVTEFISKIKDDTIVDAVVSVANAFILIYNTILDLIPSMSTFANGIKSVASAVVDVSNFFSADSKKMVVTQQISDLTATLASQQEEMHGLQEAWKRNTEAAARYSEQNLSLWLGGGQAQAISGAMREMGDSIERSTSTLKILKAELANMPEPPSPEFMKMLDPDDFRSKSQPINVASTSQPPQKAVQAEIDKHMATIRSGVGEANDLLQASTKASLDNLSKLDEARAKMLEKQALLNELENITSDPDVGLNVRLFSATKQLEAAKIFIDARQEFEEIQAAAMAAERERLTANAESEVESMTEFLSFGRESLRMSMEERQADIQAAADAGITTQANANEIKETMELEHLSKMGSMRADHLLAMKKFENQTAKERTNSILADVTKQTGIVAGSNKKLFEINKAARIAQAAMELPAAVMASYSKAGGFPWGVVPAAITLASGLAYIQQIKSSSFSGGSTGGGSPSGGSAAPAPPSATPINNQDNTEDPGKQITIYISGEFNSDGFRMAVVNAVEDAEANDEVRIINAD